MKKVEVLKTLNPEDRALVKPLQRKGLYIIDWSGEPILVVLKHFKPAGVRIQSLTKSTKLHHDVFTIPYSSIGSHKFTHASKSDFPLFINKGNKFFNAAFKMYV